MAEFTQPEVVSHEGSMPFPAEVWLTASLPDQGMSVEVVRSLGYDVEATVRDVENNVLVRERISLEEMIADWSADLIVRAMNASKEGASHD